MDSSLATMKTRLTKARRFIPDYSKHEFALFIPPKTGKPSIHIEPPFHAEYTDTETGETKVRHIARVGAVTTTSKMGCGSWSIPAGPAGVGGTCPASVLKPEKPGFVCHGCYATMGNYTGPGGSAIQNAQFVRAEFARRLLKAGGPDEFAAKMSQIVSQFYKTQRKASRSFGSFPLDPGFFRIHDSGDIFSTDYYLGWARVAKKLQNVKFWMPIRVWMDPNFLNTIASECPTNLIVRPSALYVNDHSPEMDGLTRYGLAAKTTVAASPPGNIWNCPAYLDDTKCCPNSIGPNRSTPCRVCWTEPGIPVNYTPHGTVYGKKKHRAVKQNPGVDLFEVWNAHYAGKVRENPAMSIEQRVAKMGGASTDEWMTLLDRLGVDDADFVEQLERVAEWEI